MYNPCCFCGPPYFLACPDAAAVWLLPSVGECLAFTDARQSCVGVQSRPLRLLLRRNVLSCAFLQFVLSCFLRQLLVQLLESEESQVDRICPPRRQQGPSWR